MEAAAAVPVVVAGPGFGLIPTAGDAVRMGARSAAGGPRRDGYCCREGCIVKKALAVEWFFSRLCWFLVAQPRLCCGCGGGMVYRSMPVKYNMLLIVTKIKDWPELGNKCL